MQVMRFGLNQTGEILAPTLVALAGQTSDNRPLRFNGDPHWSPRNSQPRTPPGPEGSNGSGYAVCRGAAGGGHRHIAHRELIGQRPFQRSAYLPIMLF